MTRSIPSVSRRALFDLVWSKPMTTIAREQNTSAAHVRALATRLGLSVPVGGHWMKADVGKAPPTPEYRADPAIEDQLHEITRPRPRLPRSVSNPAPVKPEVDVSEGASRSGVEHSSVEPVQAAVEPQKRVRATRSALLRAKPGERIAVGGRGKFRLLVSLLTAERAASILDAVVVAITERGWAIADQETGLALVADGEMIGFMMEEKLSAEPHIPTPAELREQADYIKKCALADRGIGYRPWREPKLPVHDHVPGGELALKIDQNYAYNSQRRTFADGKRQRVATMIDLFVETLAECAKAIKTRRADDERREREVAEAQERRRRHENQARVEGYRITFLQKQIDRNRELEGLEALILRWEASDLSDDSFKGMLNFAREYRDRLARALGPTAIGARVTDLKLMDDNVSIYDVRRIE